jgi:hypothetical protein
MNLKNYQEQQIALLNALREQARREVIPNPGSRKCRCGKTISANKAECFSCAEERQAA